MAELLDQIRGKLHEEKWTRTNIESCSIKNFYALDELYNQIAEDEELIAEAESTCEEQLATGENSLSALYLVGLIELKTKSVDYARLFQLINIFMENKKWGIVEFLAQKILKKQDNSHALRVLAKCYEEEGKEDEKYEVWERLTRVDQKEADIVKALAERKENGGDKEAANRYYKKALHRYINVDQYVHTKEIWSKLIERGEDFEFFYTLLKKIISNRKRIEKGQQLLGDLYVKAKENENYDEAIKVLKWELSLNPKDSKARKEIVECYREKYKNNSQLEKYIELSNLSQSWRNVFEAIEDFEKHIVFDEGNFVYHKSWGIGRINTLANNEIIIDFVKKRNHKMSFQMGFDVLSPISNSHIWVLKTIWPKEKLKKKVKESVAWTLKIIIKSFDSADLKKIKSELVPAILTPSEWVRWSAEAKEILKTDPLFGNLPDKVDLFVLRDKPMSYVEKLYNHYKAESNFFKKLHAARIFIDEYQDESSSYQDLFADIFQYFGNILKGNIVNEQMMASFLFLKEMETLYNSLNGEITKNFEELYRSIEDPIALFLKIEENESRRQFLTCVRRGIDEWSDFYAALFPHYTSSTIINGLLEEDRKEKLQDIFQMIINHYRDYRESFIWLARYILSEGKNFDIINIGLDRIYIGLINLLALTFRDIENKKDVSLNRKVNRGIITLLFGDKKLIEFTVNSDVKQATRIFSLVSDIPELDPGIKHEIQDRIMKKFPSIKLSHDSPELAVSSRKEILTLEESFREKQQELKNIIEVEIPDNSKEIGVARELGDLKENAEYKAAKERQESLNIMATKLQEEIDQSRIIKLSEVNNKKVAFGTVIELENLVTKECENYTILGPWESNPDKKIISYLSPFGNQFLGKKAKTELSFTINEREYSYQILSIAVLEAPPKR